MINKLYIQLFIDDKFILMINKNQSEGLQSCSLDFCMPWDKLKLNKGWFIGYIFIL